MSEKLTTIEATNDNEAPSNFRELKEAAPGQFRTLVEHIDGFEEKSTAEKIEDLNHLFETLEEAGNENRFVAERVSRYISKLEAQQHFDEEMKKLAA